MSRLHAGRGMWREFKKCLSITGDFAGKKYSVVMKREFFPKRIVNRRVEWVRVRVGVEHMVLLHSIVC